MTFASPSADCGAYWSSMRFMIAERQDKSIAAPWTSAHGEPLAAEREVRLGSSAVGDSRWADARRSEFDGGRAWPGPVLRGC